MNSGLQNVASVCGEGEYPEEEHTGACDEEWCSKAHRGLKLSWVRTGKARKQQSKSAHLRPLELRIFSFV